MEQQPKTRRISLAELIEEADSIESDALNTHTSISIFRTDLEKYKDLVQKVIETGAQLIEEVREKLSDLPELKAFEDALEDIVE